MRKEIKMPDTVTTLSQYNEWVKSFDTPTTELSVTMKKRTNHIPYAMTEHKARIHYLIDDTVSSGLAKISSFNRIFKFTLIECK